MKAHNEFEKSSKPEKPKAPDDFHTGRVLATQADADQFDLELNAYLKKSFTYSQELEARIEEMNKIKEMTDAHKEEFPGDLNG